MTTERARRGGDLTCGVPAGAAAAAAVEVAIAIGLPTFRLISNIIRDYGRRRTCLLWFSMSAVDSWSASQHVKSVCPKPYKLTHAGNASGLYPVL